MNLLLCFHSVVRRLISIALVLLFGLPAISPLFALSGAAESKLPACCRKNGAHHCTMSMEQLEALASGEHFAATPSKCPMFPKAVSPAPHRDLSFNRPAVLFAEVLSHPALHRQTEAWARVALEGARQKRGPPSIRLS